MEGFSYNNIFDTKGIEYLIIISFLLLIIPFWMIINKRTAAKKTVGQATSILTTGILRVPQGLFYSKNHTWAFLEQSGNARIGMNDFLVHATGNLKVTDIISSGTSIRKGDQLAVIEQEGKRLKVFAPVSGVVTAINSILFSDAEILNDDPYGKGWFCKVKPSDWKSDTSTYYLAEDAVTWIKNELDRFKEFLAHSSRLHYPEASLVIMQDGGEFCDNPLRELPDEVWQDFQKSFLN
jgi:glycine cleavage system H protein